MIFATPVIPAKAGISDRRVTVQLRETPAFAEVSEVIRG